MSSEGAYTLYLVKIGDEETGAEYWANPILKYATAELLLVFVKLPRNNLVFSRRLMNSQDFTFS
ncbi:hypothetical protein GCM10010912_52710 [Paenibacillus albidus]|uniref:Uncharacterized protein n=1 Tax=Paenibacillus albidus TaxID=2041023 RepID=A0A917FTX9_9BACL|nr:hypothetical protein GCM10010912_52710 [Paenibacillus albidus]